MIRTCGNSASAKSRKPMKENEKHLPLLKDNEIFNVLLILQIIISIV